MGVQISLRPRKRGRDRMEIEVLDQWACLLEPPGEACGESQRTTVRLSNFTVDDQPQAPETHTPRGLHLCLELVRCTEPVVRNVVCSQRNQSRLSTASACRARHAGMAKFLVPNHLRVARRSRRNLLRLPETEAGSDGDRGS